MIFPVSDLSFFAIVNSLFHFKPNWSLFEFILHASTPASFLHAPPSFRILLHNNIRYSEWHFDINRLSLPSRMRVDFPWKIMWRFVQANKQAKQRFERKRDEMSVSVLVWGIFGSNLFQFSFRRFNFFDNWFAQTEKREERILNFSSGCHAMFADVLLGFLLIYFLFFWEFVIEVHEYANETWSSWRISKFKSRCEVNSNERLTVQRLRQCLPRLGVIMNLLSRCQNASSRRAIRISHSRAVGDIDLWNVS